MNTKRLVYTLTALVVLALFTAYQYPLLPKKCINDLCLPNSGTISYPLHIRRKLAELHNVSGYLIEFKNKPLFVQQKIISGDLQKNKVSAFSSTGLKTQLQAHKNLLEQEHSMLAGHLSSISHSLSSGQMSSLSMSQKDFPMTHYYKLFNGVSLSEKLSDQEIIDILSLDYVKNIYPDQKMQITINESLPRINATDVYGLNDSYRNLTGFNVTIAIIDTGIDYTHIDMGNCSPRITQGDIHSYSSESIHPYTNYYDNTATITVTGFDNISVHFSNISVESGYDYIYILDGDDTVIQSITGSLNDYWSDSVSGDTIKVRLVTDYSITDWGYAVDQVLNGTVSFNWTNCSKMLGGYDFVNSDNDPMDDNGHGTHCAGIASANATNVKGVAPESLLYAYKVLDSSGSGSSSDIIAAIELASDPNNDTDSSDMVDVISMSLGGSGDPDDALSIAVDNAVDLGISVVVAAGNDGPDNNTVSCPGCARKALTVGALYKSPVAGNLYAKLISINDSNESIQANPFVNSNLTSSEGITKELLYAASGYAENFTGQNFTDRIALIQRGKISYDEKVSNAESANVSGVIMYNDEANNFIGDLENASNISVVSISQSDGEYFIVLINSGTTFVNLVVQNSTKEIADFSSRGPSYIYNKPDVMAPGVMICSTRYPGAYSDSLCFDNYHAAISGTSMAAPMVAGAAALIKQKHRNWTGLQIKAALENTAIGLGEDRNAQGSGRINLLYALNYSYLPPVALITQLKSIDYRYD